METPTLNLEQFRSRFIGEKEMTYLDWCAEHGENGEKLPQPHEITFDVDAKIHVASFSYYPGMKFAKAFNMINVGAYPSKGSAFKDENMYNYIVCCGDVMFRCGMNDWPHIERRKI